MYVMHPIQRPTLNRMPFGQVSSQPCSAGKPRRRRLRVRLSRCRTRNRSVIGLECNSRCRANGQVSSDAGTATSFRHRARPSSWRAPPRWTCDASSNGQPSIGDQRLGGIGGQMDRRRESVVPVQADEFLFVREPIAGQAAKQVVATSRLCLTVRRMPDGRPTASRRRRWITRSRSSRNALEGSAGAVSARSLAASPFPGLLRGSPVAAGSLGLAPGPPGEEKK